MLSHPRVLAVLTVLTFCLCFVNFSDGRAEQPFDVRSISLVGASRHSESREHDARSSSNLDLLAIAIPRAS